MTPRQLTPRWLTLAGGRQLYVEAAPASGGPTVVCESGMGLSRSIWAPLAAELPEDFGMVTYDRSGLGRSPATVGPRTLKDLARDLATVVEATAPDGPLILVGHSWGGPIVRIVAATLTDRLSRMVLLDPTDERADAPETVKPASRGACSHRAAKDQMAQDQTSQASAVMDQAGQTRAGQNQAGQNQTGQDQIGQTQAGQGRLAEDQKRQGRRGADQPGVEVDLPVQTDKAAADARTATTGQAHSDKSSSAVSGASASGAAGPGDTGSGHSGSGWEHSGVADSDADSLCDECADTDAAAQDSTDADDLGFLSPLIGVAARLAAQTGMYWLHAQWLARNMPREGAAAFVKESSTADHARAQLRELDSYFADLVELVANPPELVEVPVVIVSGGGTWPVSKGRQRLIEAHRESADAYVRGEHVLLERCDHYPMLTHVTDVKAAVCGKD